MRGMIGLRGQDMSGVRRDYPRLAGMIIGMRTAFSSNDGSYTIPEPLLADIFAWGAGGGGATGASTIPTGGGGGSAGYTRMLLSPGDVISWTLGPSVRGVTASTSGGSNSGFNGVDTVVTVRDRVMTAQGGRAGQPGSPAPRSFATGFDVNRYGGGSGEAGEFGAAAQPGGGAGGSAGGFSDMFPGLIQPRGMSTAGSGQGSLYPAAPTVGGGAKESTTDGLDATWTGGGLVLVMLYRV